MALQFTCRRALSVTLNHNKLCPLHLFSTQSEKNSLIPANNSGNRLVPDRKLDFDAESLASRGYLRSQKPYSPPEDVGEVILKICEKYCKSENSSLSEGLTKYKILKECSDTLKHTVPNSLLHRINTIAELCEFYKIPVNMSVPLDQMKHIDLPKNLHVLYEYVRFHPETDTKFGGISAFPESSTIVSNLKSKKKYAGYNAKKRSL